MSIYEKRSAWKVYMMIAGVIIMIIVMGYTSYLASSLRDGERSKVELLARAYEEIANSDDLNKDVTIPLEIIEASKSIPIITYTDRDNLVWHNFPDGTTHEVISKELDKLEKSGADPIVYRGYGIEQLIYFKPSRLSKYVTFFPLVMLLMLASFQV